MKAVFFDNQNISWRNLPDPRPGADQALIRVTMAGICRTDVELWSGYYTFAGVPGHEFVGVVEEAPGRPDLVGRRVVAEINCGCGQCSECLTGDARHCAARRVIGIKNWDGCFADLVVAPVGNVFEVDQNISDEEAVFVEPLAAVLQMTTQVALTNSRRLVILGDGRLGMLIALVLKNYCPDLLLIGKHLTRLRLATDYGLTSLALEKGETPAELAGRVGSFDVVVEATGRHTGLDYALALVKSRGTIVAKTTSHERSSLNLAELVVREITLIGSRCGQFGPVLNFLREKKINVRPLIEAVFPFNQFTQAFDLAKRSGRGKVLLRY